MYKNFILKRPPLLRNGKETASKVTIKKRILTTATRLVKLSMAHIYTDYRKE